MLRSILWVTAALGGIATAVAIFDQIRQGNYPLALFYLSVFGAFVFVTARQSLPYGLRAGCYLLLSYLLVISEYYFFGISQFSHAIVFAGVVFSGLLFGIRAGVLAIIIAALTLTTRRWYDFLDGAEDKMAVLMSLDVYIDWLPGFVAYIAFLSMTVVATTMMVRLLGESLAEKSELIRELSKAVEHHDKSQEALAVSEGQYGILFERSNDAVFQIQQESGRVLQANQSAEILTGLSAGQLSQKTILDLAPGSGADILEMGKQGEGAVVLGEVALSRLDDSDRIALVQCTPGDDQTAFVIARDITDRKRLEEQFVHSQKMDAVGQLAGGVAHDFNNSLQAILGYAEIAREKLRQNQNVDSDLGHLISAGDRAKALVGQLLVFSRRQVLEISDIDLHQTIGDLLKFVRRIIGEHIELKFESTSEGSIVRADRTQIEQILMNLCINARDAMADAGDLTIRVENREVDQKFCTANLWAKPGSFVVLSVIDGGVGMSSDVQSKMFEPFFTTKELGKGTGLGLSTVFGIVSQHEGLINVESKLEEGTKIEVYLPRTESEAKEIDLKTESEVPGGTETILFADDDEMVRDITQLMLKMSGYTVLTAASGDEAIKIFDRHQSKIDLVLLDVVMPNMSGKAVHKHIVAQNPDMPVLFASGYTRDALHTDFMLDEGLQLIQKPFDRAALLRKIRELLH